MQTDDLIRNIIAGLALIVSLITAYKTLLARFTGKVSPASFLALSRVGKVDKSETMTPAIVLACFFENSGARPGILDDLRLIVKHNDGTTHIFYPQLLRDGYNVFAGSEEKDWFAFGGISLAAHAKIDKYVLFKPVNDKFKAGSGVIEVTLECRWHDSKQWSSTRPVSHFELLPSVADTWNDPAGRTTQAVSKELMAFREAFKS
jgi:hypothetical protein